MSSPNIFESVSTMFIFSKIFGYTSFSIKKNRFIFSRLGVIYPMFICFVYVGLAAFDIYTRGQQDRSGIYHIIELVNVHSFSFTTLVIMFFGIFFQKQVIDWLKTISSFDYQTRKRRSTRSIRKSYNDTKKNVLLMSFLQFFSVSLLIEDIICFFPNSYNPIRFKFIFTYCVPLFASNSLIIEVNILFLILTYRYRWINKELTKLKSKFDVVLKLRINYKIYQEHFIDDLLNVFEDLRLYYDNLHSITQKLNSLYSFRITVQVYQILVSLITNVLFFVKQWSSANEKKQSISYVLIMVELMAMNIFQIISVCMSGKNLCDEAGQTPLILHEFPCSNDIDEYVKFFSNQLLHSPVNISASNMFPLNNSLLFSIMSVVTSYLIICVQLDIPDK